MLADASGGRSPVRKNVHFRFRGGPFRFNFETGGPGGTSVRMLAVCAVYVFFRSGRESMRQNLRNCMQQLVNFGNASSAPCMHAPMCMQVQQMTHSATHESTNAGATQQIGEGPRV